MSRIWAALFAVVALWSCVNDDVDDARTIVGVGDRLPDFSVEMSDGSTVTAASLRGGCSVVVLFTTRCPDCRAVLPVVQAFHEARPDVAVVCIAREEDAARIAAYWQSNALTLPYSPQTDRSVYRLFATEGVPRIYVSDADLTVVAAFDDERPPTLDQLLELAAR